MLRVPTLVIPGLLVLIGLSACSQSTPTREADSEPAQPRVRAAESQLATAKPTTSKPGTSKPNADEKAVDVRRDDREQKDPPTRPQQVYRPDDLRRPLDEAKLGEAGIRVVESKRLKLYTDIDLEVAETLPQLIDQVYVAWEEYFGPLPPNRAGTDFQISGFVMRDIALFREFDLAPEGVLIEHGRHRRNEFWMPDQRFDYYRRHQLIHEATHSFMTFMPDSMGPVWYMEGMAEHFGSHHLNADHQATFRVMPTTEREFAGFNRITTVRDEVAQGSLLTIPDIFAFTPAEFRAVHYYAWSWALCAFLDRTPRYGERFQKLGRIASRSQFARVFDELYENDKRELATEWTLFAKNLMFGYDTTRAAIDFQPGTALTGARTIQIDADHGWQSSGVLVEKSRTYRITSMGRFTLAQDPKPWISEPQGITYRYFDGRPIGLLLGCVRTEEGPAGGQDEPMLRVFPIGRDHEFQSPTTGTLYLRLNDSWDSLRDNQGNVRVEIQAVGAQ